MKLGIVIPSYKGDIAKLQTLLDSIESQTVKPYHAVISCSSMKDTQFPDLPHYSFPLTIFVWDGRKNAAQNRNTGAKFLLDKVDLLSFFDADDIMHPQRNEHILTAFNSPENPDIVLHSYLEGPEIQLPFSEISNPRMMFNCLQRAPSGCTYNPNNDSLRIHQSQATVKKEIFQQIQFQEGVDYERREDAVFCGDVTNLPNIRSAYINAPLSKYFISGSWQTI
jgi:glycosyltransferase involved in cell wall biosynthesis